MSDNVLINARNVGVTFSGGHRALEELNLQIRDGEFVSLVGPSGCGKSTFLRLVAGLQQLSVGELTVGDSPAGQCRVSDRRVSFVFQEPTLLPWRDVRANISLPLELSGMSGDQRRVAIDESLELIGLTQADIGKKPRMLSGGMRMRVSLARALVTNPEILLLDEPFAALDDMMRQQLNEELSRLWMSRSWTSLFVTHNVAEAVFLSQRILVLSSAPARVIAEIAVPFDFPRTPGLRATPEFAELAGRVAEELRGVAS